jgi:hypothetical protein
MGGGRLCSLDNRCAVYLAPMQVIDNSPVIAVKRDANACDSLVHFNAPDPVVRGDGVPDENRHGQILILPLSHNLTFFITRPNL